MGPELPLVMDNAIENISKTSAAKDLLTSVGALDDVEKAAASKAIRAGKGKMRNRRYTLRRGPLVVYSENDGVEQAFRNLPGVELCCVSRLNLLQLAPGGHMGRFCVWSESAIKELDTIYGDNGKRIPTCAMANADLARIINSDEVQSVLIPAQLGQKKYLRKKNPLRSIKALDKLDPYAAASRRGSTEKSRAGRKKEVIAAKRAQSKSFAAQKKAFYEQASKQGNVCEDGFGL